VQIASIAVSSGALPSLTLCGSYSKSQKDVAYIAASVSPLDRHLSAVQLAGISPCEIQCPRTCNQKSPPLNSTKVRGSTSAADDHPGAGGESSSAPHYFIGDADDDGDSLAAEDAWTLGDWSGILPVDVGEVDLILVYE